jgi:hypothetical protein
MSYFLFCYLTDLSVCWRYSYIVAGGKYIDIKITLWIPFCNQARKYMLLYNAFTDEPERKWHRNIIFRTSCKTVNLVLLFSWRNTYSYRENLVALVVWFMQFMLGAGQWQLQSSLSVTALCNYICIIKYAKQECYFRSLKSEWDLSFSYKSLSKDDLFFRELTQFNFSLL